MKKIIFAFLFLIVLGCFSINFITYAEQYEESQDSATEVVNENSSNNPPPKNNILANVVLPVSLEFLGAFLGVLTALWLNFHLNKKQYKEINESLHKELLTLREDLNTQITKKHEYYRYSIPVWEINLASGNLSVLVYKHIDKKYIEIYSKIQYAQELEREYIHSRLLETNDKTDFLNAYINAIDSARIREAEEIKEMINKIENKEVM